MAIVNRGFKGRRRQAGAGLIPPGQYVVDELARRAKAAVLVHQAGSENITPGTSALFVMTSNVVVDMGVSLGAKECRPGIDHDE